MAYRAENLDTSPDVVCQPPAELPTLGLTKSLPQGPVMIGHVQHPALQVGQLRGGFPTTQDTGLQTVTTLPGQHIAVTHGGAALNSVSGPMKTEPLRLLIKSPNTEEEGQRDQERRIRREIANSNERRRMQSINAGFKSLKTILPHTDGEKLSKAAILQQTSEYITQLESDKLKLLHQNEKLRRAFADCKCNSPKHRALVCDIFDKDEGIGSPAEEDFEDMRRGIIEVRQQLDKERRMRMLYEEKIQALEAQMYPDKFNRFKATPSHRTSSDEPASSSEYSPSAIAPEPHDTKLITCARPLLPPLTPIHSKVPLESAASVTVAPVHVGYQKSLESRMAIKDDTLTGHTPSLLPEPEKAANLKSEEVRLVPAVMKEEGPAPHARQGHTVTVFSHSTKSNQPLKKRAIEIHENFTTDTTDQSLTQQPKCKVAKITSEPTAEIGTRSFLPPTLPPITLGAANLQHYPIHGLPLLPQDAVASKPSEKGHVALYPQVVATVPSYAMPAAATGHSVVASVPCQQPAPQTTRVAVASLPMQAMLPAKEVASVQPHLSRPAVETMSPMSVRNARHAPPALEGLTTYAVVHSVPNDGSAISAAGVPAPVYLTVENVKRHFADQVRQPRDNMAECPTSVPKRHLVVAPMQQSQGTVLVDAGATQRHEEVANNAMSVNVRMVYQPHPLPQTDKTQNASLALPAKTPVQEEAQRVEAVPVGPMRMTSVMQPHAFQCANLPKLQNSLQKIQSTVHPQLQQTVLCYRPPEITLNQLNAVPNLLPPPRSLHQPLILSAAPTLAQALSSASPSYVSPALQDPAAVLPARFQTFPEVGRRRKSSMSATDSCSTASISGAEEEDVKNPLLDDPDCQSEDSVPTIKLCSSDPVTSSSPRRLSQQQPVQDPAPETVAAYKEVPQADADPAVDVPDSGAGQSPSRKNATLSVLSDVAGSPLVIRRIDAIQTRRNLETIVQAIDHLEQQERRNSQDNSSAPESSPKSAQ